MKRAKRSSGRAGRFTDDTLAGCADPYACGRCLAAGDECPFHQGFGAGWDACAAFMASVVDR